MERLIKDMYGTESQPIFSLFGLKTGQWRNPPDRVMKDAGWYNQLGQRLGFGDLDTQDLKRIMQALLEEEVFIILDRMAAYFDFRKEYAKVMGVYTEPDCSVPGILYVSQKAEYIVTTGQIYRVERIYHIRSQEPERHFDGNLGYSLINPETATKLIAQYAE